MSREEYFRNYYTEHKEEIDKKGKKYYKEHKKERLTYQQNYDTLHKESILAKVKTKSLAFRGHAYSIWTAIKKYAKKWHLPICSFEQFYDNWTFDDPTYQLLYDAWVNSGYSENLSPVVMRTVKKNGFVADNLKWDIKNNYSWWNEDSTIFRKEEEDLNDVQKTYNKSSKEWRKKIRAEWKAKVKANKHVTGK